VTPLIETTAPYTCSNDSSVIGSERALQGFLHILRNWTEVERWFCDGKSYADIVDILRKANADNVEHVLEVCRAHAGLKLSSNIVGKIIDTIADAFRAENSDASSKSIVAGAQNLGDASPCLSEIGSMGGIQYSSVALRARKLLLQESLPSIEIRKARIAGAAKDLGVSYHAENTAAPPSVTSLVDECIPMADVLYPLLSTANDNSEKLAFAELYFRKLYNAQTLKDFSRDTTDLRLSFTFIAKASERVFSSSTPVTSMTDLSRAISRSGSLHELANTEGNSPNQVPSMTSRVAVCKLASCVDDIENSAFLRGCFESFPQFTGVGAKCSAGPINILYVVVLEEKIKSSQESMSVLSKKLRGLLENCRSDLEDADIRRVSFVFNKCQGDVIEEFTLPSILTYRAQLGFNEDSLFRNIEPGYACLLDLNRLSTNFSVKLLDSQQTQTAYVHLYKATPRGKALEADKKANPKPRIFVRAVGFISEFSATNLEKMLVDALNALDIAVHENGYSVDNHLFLNLVSDYEKIILDPVTVEQTTVTILRRHGDRIAALGLGEVETKLICSLTSDSPPIALRMVASNPTGYVQVMNTYVEAMDPSSTAPIFKLIGGTKASLSSSGDSSWEGMKITAPYPLTRPFDNQRKAALRASDSLYCYDLPALFDAAVEKQWESAAKKGGIEGGIRAASRPSMVMYTSELVVRHKNNDQKSWTMQHYLDGDLALSQTQRKAGFNDVGMVAWLMTLKTVEYPEVNVPFSQTLFKS
jgi:acetyl-CoA carboxylase/biotin carboxylase 1